LAISLNKTVTVI